MPSPIAHISVGYVLFAFFRKHLTSAVTSSTGKRLILFSICVFFSLLPDMDAIPGLLTGEMGRFHNQWTHSIFWAVGLSAIFALIMYRINRNGFSGWFILFSGCYGAHILMDYLTYGRGLRLFWPFVAGRYQSDPSLFSGLRWSEGFLSRTHIWMAIEEISFGVLLIAGYYAMEFIVRRISEKA